MPRLSISELLSETEAGLSFEGALAQLEETVGRLEAGEMPLEEALTLFERGVRLSRRCTTTLEAAERRIEMLVADRDDDEQAQVFLAQLRLAAELQRPAVIHCRRAWFRPASLVATGIYTA